MKRVKTVLLMMASVACGTVLANAENFVALYVLKETMERLEPVAGATPRSEDYTDFVEEVQKAMEGGSCAASNKLRLGLAEEGGYELTVAGIPDLRVQFSSRTDTSLQVMLGTRVDLRTLFNDVGFCVDFIDGSDQKREQSA